MLFLPNIRRLKSYNSTTFSSHPNSRYRCFFCFFPILCLVLLFPHLQNIFSGFTVKLLFNIVYLIICFINFSFSPLSLQDSYLVYILNELAGNSFMVFCSTCNNTQRTALLLRNLGFTAIPLHGQMSQVWAYPTGWTRQETCHLGNGLYHTYSYLAEAFHSYWTGLVHRC